MASGKLSPRQKMINMMYLVLTALLAMNVSKEIGKFFYNKQEYLKTEFYLKKGIQKEPNDIELRSLASIFAFFKQNNIDLIGKYDGAFLILLNQPQKHF